ncbi:ATP cone domain-containing protein [Shigella flexneri]
MDNLFLKIWSDHDTACDETRRCKVPFKSERIEEAILRAAKAAEVDDADYCATVAAVVSEQIQGRNEVDINEIQPQLKTSRRRVHTNNWLVLTSSTVTIATLNVKNAVA